MHKITLALLLLGSSLTFASPDECFKTALKTGDLKTAASTCKGIVGDACFSSAFKGSDVKTVGSSRVDLQACKLEYSIVSPK